MASFETEIENMSKSQLIGMMKIIVKYALENKKDAAELKKDMKDVRKDLAETHEKLDSCDNYCRTLEEKINNLEKNQSANYLMPQEYWPALPPLVRPPFGQLCPPWCDRHSAGFAPHSATAIWPALPPMV